MGINVTVKRGWKSFGTRLNVIGLSMRLRRSDGVERERKINIVGRDIRTVSHVGASRNETAYVGHREASSALGKTKPFLYFRSHFPISLVSCHPHPTPSLVGAKQREHKYKPSTTKSKRYFCPSFCYIMNHCIWSIIVWKVETQTSTKGGYIHPIIRVIYSILTRAYWNRCILDSRKLITTFIALFIFKGPSKDDNH